MKRTNKKGISLIVLVITIIVMIILAAAIVITLNNSGIINKANEAVDTTNLKQVQELAQMIWAEGYLDNKDVATIKSEIETQLGDAASKYNITVTDKGVDVTQKTEGLNEHGFYYDVPYVFDDNGMRSYMVFKQENKVEMYMHNPENGAWYALFNIVEVTYAENTITIGEDTLKVIEAGKKLEITNENGTQNMIYTEMEYHDVYYNVKYYTEDKAQYYILKSDNSIEIYDSIENTLLETVPSRAITKSSHLFVIGGTEYMVSMDGKTIRVGDNPSYLRYSNYIENHEGIIPTGGVYIKADETLLYGGDKFPETSTTGDMYVYGDYEYMYNGFYDLDTRVRVTAPKWQIDELQNGWGVRVTNDEQCLYGDIIQTINSKSIVALNHTYQYCVNMVEPASNISKLTKVIDMSSMFMDCGKLTTLPDGFVIPNSVIGVVSMFAGCENLTTLPDGFVIPNSVIDVENMFGGCEKLINLPATFKIPEKVENISYMFNGCSLLTGKIEINCNPTEYEYCLNGTQITEITGSTNLKTEILATKISEN